MRCRKIVIFGVAGSGKTELAKACAGKQPFDEGYSATVGVAVTAVFSSGNLTSRIYDTAGQERFSSALSLEHALKDIDENGSVVFTLDSTKPLKDQQAAIIEQAGMCHKSGVKGKFIVALTKFELGNKRILKDDDVTTLITNLSKELHCSPEEISRVACSARTSAGIDALTNLTINREVRTEDKREDNACQTTEDKIDALVNKITHVVIKTLQDERARLTEVYGEGDRLNNVYAMNDKRVILPETISDPNALARAQAIDRTIAELTVVISHIRKGKPSIDDKPELKKALEIPITNHLKDFNKRQGALGAIKILARGLLNIITAITVGLPFAKKKWLKEENSAGYWFSLYGKTHKAGEKAIEQIGVITDAPKENKANKPR